MAEAKVSPVQHVDEFLRLLEASRLVRSERLAELRDGEDLESEPRSLAKRLVRAGELTKWQAGQLLSGWSGLHVGKYTLLKQLESDLVGRTFLARHAQMDRLVALQTLSRKNTQSKSIVGSFLQEARNVAALDHPRIRHLYDINTEGDRFYLVWEFLDGTPLKQLVDQSGPLPLDELAEVVIQCCDGLAYAHQHNVLHGSIHAAQIIRSHDGGICLQGLATGRLIKRFTQSKDLAEAGKSSGSDVGTFELQTPESVSGKPEDARSDIYLMGATAFYLLTGEAPLPEAPVKDQLFAIDCELPATLLDLIAKMMESDPEQRFQTAEQTRVAWQQWLSTNRAVAQEQGRVDYEEDGAGLGPIQLQGVSGRHSSRAAQSSSRSTSKLTAIRQGFESLPMIWVVVGSAACGALMVAGIVFLYWFFFAAPRTAELAQRDNSQPQASAAASATDEALSPDESDEIAAEQPSSEQPSSEQASSEQASKQPRNGRSSAKKGPRNEPSAKEAAKASTPPSDSADPAATADAPTPEQPAQKNAQKNGPRNQPASKSASQAKSAPAKTNKQAPTGKRKANPPPAPNPLGQLPQILGLPSPEDNQQWLSLGKLSLRPNQLCFITLLGGDAAIRGDSSIALSNADGGLAETKWDLFLVDQTPLAIAHLELREGQLMFQWLPAAETEEGAVHLTNCLLEMSVGKFKHVMALREPLIVEPLGMNIDRTASHKWLIPALPDPTSIQIELLGIEGPLKVVAMEPKNSFSANKGQVEVKLGDNDQDAYLDMEVEASVRRTTELSITPMVTLGDERVRLTANTIKRIVATAQLNQQRVFANVKRLEELEKKTPANQGKARVTAGLKQARQALVEATTFSDRADRLVELQGTFADEAKLKLRIYYDLLGQQVDLLKTR